jgi:hypothetical protein
MIMLYFSTFFAFVFGALVIQLYAAAEQVPLRETVMPTMMSGVIAAGVAGGIYLIGGGAM